jgi:hypothetical protein
MYAKYDDSALKVFFHAVEMTNHRATLGNRNVKMPALND